MSLWWLQPGWTETLCACCGRRIYPEGDPDWGMCFECFSADLNAQQLEQEQHENDEEQREAAARDECERRGIDPDALCADGGVEAWMIVDRELRQNDDSSSPLAKVSK